MNNNTTVTQNINLQHGVVEFGGFSLPTAFDGETIWVSIKSACDQLGVAAFSQIRKLESSEDFSCNHMMVTGSDGKMYEQVCLDADHFYGWLFTISTSRVKPEIRERLKAFKDKSMSVLTEYWQTGKVNEKGASITRTPGIENQFKVAGLVSDFLNLSSTARLTMATKLVEMNGVTTSLLPDYTTEVGLAANSEKPVMSAKDLLIENDAGFGSAAFNKILYRLGYLDQHFRSSTGKAAKNGKKPFWSISEKGLKYGKNDISIQNTNETQPRWYIDSFPELLDEVIAEKEGAA